MRVELKRLHLENGSTSIYVTHDQVEAMSLADRIVVMNDGVLQQVGTPTEVYLHPANLFVAQFIGSPGDEHRRHAAVRASGRQRAGASSTARAFDLPRELLGMLESKKAGRRPVARHPARRRAA